MQNVGNISWNLEDYLEHILEIIKKNGIAKVSDIARSKGVSMPSVNNAVSRLAKEGFVTHDLYKNINLTESGARLASELRRRHELIKTFLTDVLNVSESVAENDACSIEHHVQPETVNKLLEYLQNNNK